MSQPLSQSDIIFPHLSNTPNLSSTLSSLKRSTLSIHNRLGSIISDSEFVASIAAAYDLPLVANERCGSWYIPPEVKKEGVYFKSTDGHMSQWGFSLRRLNLQLLDVVGKWGGAIVVDSTRRGKSMPDALSKTVPIWCCVINRAIFGEDRNHKLHTPPQAVSASEHAQIESKLDGFVKQFLDVCKPNIPILRAKLQRPLRPIWVTQQSSLPDIPPSFKDFHPVLLCTASRRVQGAEGSEGGYIQGAADDHEAWSHGLAAPVFWKHKDLLLETSEEDAPGLVEELMAQETSRGVQCNATLVKPTTSLYISSSENLDTADFDIIISCLPAPLSTDSLKGTADKLYLHIKCQVGKLGSRDLRNEFPKLITSLEKYSSKSPRILVRCPTGKDLSVGISLAILCLFVDDIGNLDLCKRRDVKEIDKNFIKQRLSWITTSNPTLNPSRATLQSVNSFLLASHDPKIKSAVDVNHHQNLPIQPEQQQLDGNCPTPASASTGSGPEDEMNPSSGPDLSTIIFQKLLASQSKPWTFRRTLCSSLPTHPSGNVTGTATITPCHLPAPSPPTLLYAEEGTFTTDTGLSFTARRKYVYQLHTVNDDVKDTKSHIVVRFFDDEKFARKGIDQGVGDAGEGIGALFVEMGTLKVVDGVSAMQAQNKEQHLCAADLYKASWRFDAGMLGQEGKEDWEVRYDVQGPKKEYVSVTKYVRTGGET